MIDRFGKLGVLRWRAKQAWYSTKEVVLLRPARVRWQRSKRGWAYRDLWNFDQYLCKLVGTALLDMAEETHGYPGDYENADAWRAHLRQLAEGLLAWDEDNFLDKDKYAEAVDALHGVADVLGSLWD